MLKTLPTWLRAAVITSIQTFIAATLVGFINLFGEVQSWVDDGVVPDFSIFARTVASAAIAAAVGVVTAVYRVLRPVENAYPEQPRVGPLDKDPADVRG